MPRKEKRKRPDYDEEYSRLKKMLKIAKMRDELSRVISQPTMAAASSEARDLPSTSRLDSPKTGPEPTDTKSNAAETAAEQSTFAVEQDAAMISAVEQDAAIIPVPADEEKESPTLDEETLAILGKDPTQKPPEENLHPDVAARWNNWLQNDVLKEVNAEIIPKYQRQLGNCSLDAPTLNPELATTLGDSIVRRDKYFSDSQNLTGSALAALGLAIKLILSDELVDGLDLLEKLSDAGKILTQVHRLYSTTRRAYISPSINKDIRSTLNATKPGTYLYGEKLTEKVKEAKKIQQVSAELKVPTPKTFQKQPARHLNWKPLPVKNYRPVQGGDKSKTSARTPSQFNKQNYSNQKNMGTSRNQAEGMHRTQFNKKQ